MQSRALRPGGPGVAGANRQMAGRPRNGAAQGSDGGPDAGPAIVPAKVRMPRVRWLPRERLDALLPVLWRQRLALVVAPPGSGKTTLLAGWAASAGVPVAWYRAESTDATSPALLRYLEGAFREALGALPGPWATVEEAVTSVETHRDGRVLLVVDDLHTLTGTPAEASLERFIDYAPPWLAVAAGSRTMPAFNLSRRRVAGELLELGVDDLRFRSWEVEQLFRDFYGEALRGDELARLARRTEGWVAGLQLFHLATRGKTADERARVLAAPGPSGRLLREYLARNVVAELPAELRSFLVDTCVLRRLSGPLCDALREASGSRELLEELERRGVFTVALDDQGTYRYHEVLRSHLEGLLVEEAGEAAARVRSRRAAELLEADGAVAEALAAYSRAEDWSTVDRLLRERGERLAAGPAAWMDSLPPALLVADPWLTLATARRHRAEGHWAAAVDAYARAEALFGAAESAVTCRRERLALAAWLDPLPAPGQDWSGALRAAVVREPLQRRDGGGSPADRAPSQGDRLAMGLASLAGGRVRDARQSLSAVAEDPAASPAIAAAATLGAAVAGLLGGDMRATVEVEAAVAAAEHQGIGWLARVGRAALAVAGPTAGEDDPAAAYGPAAAGTARAAAARDDDRWGEALAALAEGWALLDRGDGALEPLEIAAARFRSLGAGTLEAWARAMAALVLARSGAPDAREAGLAAEALARSTVAPAPRLFAHLALSRSDPAHRTEHRALVAAAIDETGLRPPDGVTDHVAAIVQGIPVQHALATRDGGPRGHAGNGLGALRIRTFGRFEMEVGGRPLDLTALKPRPRALLRLLALNAGRPVHREVLVDALWPEADPELAARSLHVALSAVRRELEPGVERGAGELLVRDGDAYRIDLPAGSEVDLLAFDDAVARGRAARARGDDDAAIDALRAALAVYGGELLPEDGPADWVVARRERARGDAVEAAQTLAGLLLPDRPGEAAAVCATGLALDAFHDPLWRLLIEARERAGDQAAATSARAGYARMLAELGLSPADKPLTGADEIAPAGAAIRVPGTRSR